MIDEGKRDNENIKTHKGYNSSGIIKSKAIAIERNASIISNSF